MIVWYGVKVAIALTPGEKTLAHLKERSQKLLVVLPSRKLFIAIEEEAEVTPIIPQLILWNTLSNGTSTSFIHVTTTANQRASREEK